MTLAVLNWSVLLCRAVGAQYSHRTEVEERAGWAVKRGQCVANPALRSWRSRCCRLQRAALLKEKS
jgi:hypothetical protein